MWISSQKETAVSTPVVRKIVKASATADESSSARASHSSGSGGGGSEANVAKLVSE